MATAAKTVRFGTLPNPRTRLIGRESECELARAFLLEAAVPI